MAQLVFLGRLAGPHQIAQGCFVCGIGNAYRGQLSGAVTLCQFFGVPAIRLHPGLRSLQAPAKARSLRGPRPTRLHEFPVEHMDGFGFGLGVAVRTQAGVAGVPGTLGEFLWSGAQGTMFWVDPREEMAVVFLANTPGPARRHYRELVKTLVVQAIAD
jgi:CubicO group peptidase (beta-lactamase class C family)